MLQYTPKKGKTIMLSKIELIEDQDIVTYQLQIDEQRFNQ